MSTPRLRGGVGLFDIFVGLFIPVCFGAIGSAGGNRCVDSPVPIPVFRRRDPVHSAEEAGEVAGVRTAQHSGNLLNGKREVAQKIAGVPVAQLQDKLMRGTGGFPPPDLPEGLKADPVFRGHGLPVGMRLISV